ncbi:MAG TPA: SgcJ/EcaC family oxidoreductase [Terriglobales bacterium]|jgi:uncharacterized protein (TIGR02246 family)|nr:SgcJ/EcaC family oxidoreductase [Terriglobales bacterium]
MSVRDEQALRDVVRGLETAWNRGDSVAWAEFFAEDADFIHILGGHFSGRIAIEQGHRVIFDTIYKGSTNKYTVNKVRFTSPDSAVVFVLAELKVSREGFPPVLHARPTLVTQRTPDGWKIVAFQNTMITPDSSSGQTARIATALNDAIAEHHPIKGMTS